MGGHRLTGAIMNCWNDGFLPTSPAEKEKKKVINRKPSALEGGCNKRRVFVLEAGFKVLRCATASISKSGPPWHVLVSYSKNDMKWHEILVGIDRESDRDPYDELYYDPCMTGYFLWNNQPESLIIHIMIALMKMKSQNHRYKIDMNVTKNLLVNWHS